MVEIAPGLRLCFPLREGVYESRLYLPVWSSVLVSGALYVPAAILALRLAPERKRAGLVLLGAAGIVASFIIAELLAPQPWLSPACIH